MGGTHSSEAGGDRLTVNPNNERFILKQPLTDGDRNRIAADVRSGWAQIPKRIEVAYGLAPQASARLFETYRPRYQARDLLAPKE